jgi:hypothetical protein
MLTANLLDKNLKKRVNKQKIKTLVAKIFGTITFYFFLICLTLVASSFYFKNNFIELNQKKQEVAQNNHQLFDDINRIDREMNKIVDFQENQINWSEKILDLSSIVPADIMIKQLQISKKDLTFRITGMAKNRDSFLVFKKDLEDLNFSPKVISPLSNITSKENLTFNLSGHIQKENEK